MANSINNKTGSSLTSNSTVDEMITTINPIKTLEQATADANVIASLNCGGSYTIPAGYHNGSGKVTTNSLAKSNTRNSHSSQYYKW